MDWRKRGSGRTALLFTTLCAVLWLPACGSRKKPGEAASTAGNAAPDEDRVVLRVSEASYSAADFSRYVQETVGGSVQKFDAVALSNLFDRFIDDKILLQAALERGVTLSTQEKQAYVEKAEKGTFTEEEKAALLASDSGPLVDKMKIEKYSRALGQDLSVGDDEVREYYDGHPEEFSLPERVQVSQILVPTEAEAVEIWEKVRFSDEEGFRAVARAQSDGPEASEGGEMGVFQKGQLPPDMEAAVFGMAEGEVSPVVQSSYGYHIFRLDRRFAPETISLESASPAIKHKLLGLKLEALTARHLAELKKTFDWEVFPENLFFPYQRENS